MFDTLGSAFPVLKIGYEEMAIASDDIRRSWFSPVCVLGAGLMVLFFDSFGRKERQKFTAGITSTS